MKKACHHMPHAQGQFLQLQLGQCSFRTWLHCVPCTPPWETLHREVLRQTRKERFEDLDGTELGHDAGCATESYDEEMAVLVSDLKGFTSTVRKYGTQLNVGSQWAVHMRVEARLPA